MHALSNAHANHIIFYLKISTYFFIIKYLGGLFNITKCIDKGFLVLQAFSSTYLTAKQKCFETTSMYVCTSTCTLCTLYNTEPRMLQMVKIIILLPEYHGFVSQ